MELLAILSRILGNRLSVAGKDPLCCHKAVKANGTTSMQLGCRDSNLCTETESEAVCKPCGAIDKNVRTIHISCEKLTIIHVLGYYCVSMMRSMTLDMLHSFLHGINGFDCTFKTKILGMEISFGC